MAANTRDPRSTGKQTDGLWARQSPKTKQILLLAGATVAFFAVMLPLMSGGPSVAPERKQTPVGELLPASRARELGLTGLAKDLDELEALVRTKSGDAAQVPTGNPAGVSPALIADFERMKARLELLERGGGQVAPAAADGTGAWDIPPAPAAAPPPRPVGTLLENGPQQLPPTAGLPPAPPPPIPRLRTIGMEPVVVETTEAAAEERKPKFYLPSGAMISGVLITGLDAATGRAASQDPTPVLVRIKREAILPNRFRADVRECFALLAGTGDLSSERAFLRGEQFSCVRRDGGVIDMPLNVYAVGEDGKAGLRGTLVSKQGQAIGKAMLAGLAEGASRAFSQNGNANFGAGGSDLAGGVEAGAYGGFGSALDRVAQFYINLANQIFPVVEISAGRPVTLVVVKGTEVVALGD